MKFFLAAFLCLVCVATGRSQQFSTYAEMRRAFLSSRPDTKQVYSVEGLMIDDGATLISLDSGTIVLGTEVQGRRYTAAFVGKGAISFTPTLLVERRQLKRFYPADVYNEECTTAFFMFTDSTLLSQLKGLSPSPVKIPKEVDGLFSTGLPLGYHGEDSTIDIQYARTLLNNTPAHCFSFEAKGDGTYGCVVIHDPYADEPYTFTLSKWSNGQRRFTPVNQCPPTTGRVYSDDRGVKAGEQVYLAQHTMNIAFASDLSMRVVDRIEVQVLEEGTQWMNFDLMPQLPVDSVRLYRGERLTLEQRKGEGDFWVKLPARAHKNDSMTIEIFYHGRIVDRIGDFTFMSGSISWYPQHGWSQLGYFDLEFDHEQRYKLISVGNRVSSTEHDDRVTSRWVVGKPQRNASFNIGVFKEFEIKEPGIPSISIHHVSTSHEEDVALDVKQSMQLFTKLFGPLTISHIYATELPGYHGEAFPGMLHLSHEAFENFGDDFFAEQFIAHEVGHQWWGIGLDMKTYRDRWLSEAFAEYSALMYSQAASEDRSKFFRLLDETAEGICGRGSSTIGKPQDAPMISLGHRVSYGGKSEDYNNFVYYKGAWVVHMLRNMMLDLRTMKEDNFILMISSFFKAYQGKHASTDDLRMHIEKLTGKDMRWFFDQWVDNNQIPTYRVAWKKEHQADGTWKVTLRVKQEDVDESFYMLVPIKVAFDGNAVQRMRIAMTGAQAEIALPPFPQEPDDVLFNDLHSVLCTVKTEGY